MWTAVFGPGEEVVNVLLAHGHYDRSDRNLVHNILNDLWYLSPGPGVEMDWLPPHRTIVQDERYASYEELLVFITARMIKEDGDAVLILPHKIAGDNISILSPIYINSPMRKTHLHDRGVNFRNITKRLQ